MTDSKYRLVDALAAKVPRLTVVNPGRVASSSRTLVRVVSPVLSIWKQ